MENVNYTRLRVFSQQNGYEHTMGVFTFKLCFTLKDDGRSFVELSVNDCVHKRLKPSIQVTFAIVEHRFEALSLLKSCKKVYEWYEWYERLTVPICT